MDTQRRGLITWFGRGMAALVGTGGLLLAGRFLRPLQARDLARRVDLGPPAGLPAGSARYLPGPDVHVIHDTRGIYAVSGRCTHLGCSLLRRPKRFDCPCHGARFDLLGRPISGPATRTLTWLKVDVRRLRGTRSLVLHLDESVEPGTMKRI